MWLFFFFADFWKGIFKRAAAGVPFIMVCLTVFVKNCTINKMHAFCFASFGGHKEGHAVPIICMQHHVEWFSTKGDEQNFRHRNGGV